MIESLLVSDLDSYKVENPSNVGKYLTSSSSLKLTTLNVFIGLNNSGKSRFLRSIVKREHKIIPSNPEYSEYLKFREEINEGNLSSFAETLQEITFSNLGDNIWQEPYSFVDRVFHSQHFGSGDINDRCRLLRGQLNSIKSCFEYPIIIYVPMLRSLRPISSSSDSALLETTMRDYFSNQSVSHFALNPVLPCVQTTYISSGLNFYSVVRSLLLGDRHERDNIREFETFLSDTFYGGQPVVLIPKEKDNKNIIYIALGNDEYPIHEHGDGISQIIMLTWPLFFLQGKPLILCIEEPELSLHAGLQRKFIDTVIEKGRNWRDLRVFVTSHSNHFIDSTIDNDEISVFRFSRTKDERLTTITPT